MSTVIVEAVATVAWDERLTDRPRPVANGAGVRAAMYEPRYATLLES